MCSKGRPQVKTWVWTSPIYPPELLTAYERTTAIEEAEIYAMSIFHLSTAIVITDVRSTIQPNPDIWGCSVIKTTVKGFVC